MARRTIGLLGGIPPALGGGGLEVQIARTGEALEALGHRTVRVETATADERFDVLHAFGAEAGVWHALEHWSRNVCPLVVSPVIVVSPGWEERAMRVSSRLPLATGARMRRAVVRRADAVVALTRYERKLIEALGADAARVTVIPNGADPVEQAGADSAGEYALLLGSVSARKRQADIVRELGRSVPLVVAGGFHGSDAELADWEAAVRESGARWLGDVRDPVEVTGLLRGAAALVHLSHSETQSLAVLEALAAGTPVVASDIPSHRELAEHYPDHVRVVGGLGEAAAALESLRGTARKPAPSVPAWEEVARRLEAVYDGLLGAPGSTA